MVLFKIKASIHLTGITGVLMYIIGLSFHFSKDVTLLAAAIIVFTGMVASARLYLKAHTGVEIILGIFIGLIPQLLTFQYWL
ncbi:hypothetical protein Y10_30930 [Neptunitalea sp. Y10]|uniref:Phosphatidic acid phosphatase type 2/haloperoxidase domain-containing protein n=2 Tax=Neptunitalea lumnitzerae TaxID=2965509 RepID=A0ABQ5MMT8_9FLAO|nr:hypothetical protein Y10_30930 [Neptunitalea sp. Y10]